MKYKWIKAKTKGVRYYEHPTRKHGVRKDRYFTIRYKLNGKDKEEALGWESEGWTEKKASAKLYELKENHRTGIGEATLLDKRRIAIERAKREEETQILKEKEQILFSSIFDKYMNQARQDKTVGTWRTELGLYKKWLQPALGNMAMKDISP